MNPTAIQPCFMIGPIPVMGDLILSPMDGLSDFPFRTLVRRLGSAMSYTEFVNALDVINGHPHLEERLSFLETERPVGFQLFDDDPDRILAAALRLRLRNPDIIDINMGCPARSVSGRGAGAGLLRTPRKVAEIFSKLSHALDIPITGKIRLGWDDSSRNYLEIARIIQENGGQSLAVHARTRLQGYKGKADWDAIAEIKQVLSIPVIGNGDVLNVADIDRMKVHTGCDGVMIARGALGNPWIFSRLDRHQVSPELMFSTIQQHFQLSINFYGVQRGMILFRKFTIFYLGKTLLTRDQRASLLNMTDPDEFMLHLWRVISNAANNITSPLAS